MSAPLPLTKAMVDVQRRLAEFHRLRNAAEECGEPVNVRGLLAGIAFSVACWIVGAGCVYLLGGF